MNSHQKPIIETLATGDEVVTGDVIDSNGALISKLLRQSGFAAQRHSALPDDFDLLVRGIREISERADLCVACGGLGPTEDDLTADVVAQVLGVPVAISEEAIARMKARFAKLGYRFSENNFRSARYPDGATVYQNEVGTAPAFSAKIGRCHFFFLPGVPKEFSQFARSIVVPWAIEQWKETATVVKQLKLLGWGESHLSEKFQDYPQLFPRLKIGYRAHAPEVWLKLTATEKTRAAAEQALKPAIEEAYQRVGADIFGEDEDELPILVHRLLSVAGAGGTSIRFGTAESCTGGAIAQQLVKNAGSSVYFQGSVVAYSNELKEKLLGVSQLELETHGAVSSQVVEAMARGGLERLGLDLAISVSGVAGPGGGSPDKPVGLVYFGLARKAPDGKTETRSIQRNFRGDRDRIQKAATLTALDWVRREIKGIPIAPNGLA